ncbi:MULTISPECIES: arylsulfatase [unclassified Oceanispirochaeta]|uniref:sulfatase family protein n=1 Tax=unclassified Oceanispirochaeta TaxID=2635722 RepID=UPI000E098DA4|nr:MULTISPECIES: arylsulfatase [unclassified Oceanispirochaeta]MBF9015527.1 arylsulfatase [Oceanispirochaeta sp. M2]NPD71986.1 arylsulfatase [Oceanispirochaeta sp. M1]RDG32792.1 arylsulfatase [Oceanispirochaeta sp. M1]
MEKKPNVIYFLCDDLGWGDVSLLNPESKIETPNIDKLGSSGLVFTDAHSGSAVCTPSRYSILTGRYCWRTKELKEDVNGGFSPGLIRDGRKTLASELKKQGYSTACIGKWHIGMDWSVSEGSLPMQYLSDEMEDDVQYRIDYLKDIKNGPLDAGFDYYYGLSASLDMPPYTWLENNRVVDIPDIIISGEYGERCFRTGVGVSDWTHESVLPTIINKSKNYITECSKTDKPFFLYLPINGPHTPIVPKKEWIGKSGCGLYGDFIMEIDDYLGQISDTVKKAGIEDNTLIIFTSDNGPELFTHQYKENYSHSSTWKFRGYKRDNWEGGHRVPYIISWPSAVKAGRHTGQYVELVDIAATICDLVKIKISPDFCEDSYSMLPILLEDQGQSLRDFGIHHSSRGYWAVRMGKWKLLLHSGSGGNETACSEDGDIVQLYDMEKDPFESENIYKEHPELLLSIKQFCTDLIKNGRSTAGMPQPVENEGDWSQLVDLLDLSI